MEDIAIVGLACRLPGEATSEENLWDEVLAKGKSTWSEFPSSRFNADGFYHPDNQRQGSVSHAFQLTSLQYSAANESQACLPWRPLPQE